MQIKVSKEMITEVFDFVEGRRTKKKGDGLVLRGVRGAKFPHDLLRKREDNEAWTDYMDGVRQAEIGKKHNLEKKPPVYFRRMGLRYSNQVNLYWTYVSVMNFIEPVRQLEIETVLPSQGDYGNVLLQCYKHEIYTIGDFLDFFVRYEVTTVRYKLLKIKMDVYDEVFRAIRNKCFVLLEVRNEEKV